MTELQKSQAEVKTYKRELMSLYRALESLGLDGPIAGDFGYYVVSKNCVCNDKGMKESLKLDRECAETIAFIIAKGVRHTQKLPDETNPPLIWNIWQNSGPWWKLSTKKRKQILSSWRT